MQLKNSDEIHQKVVDTILKVKNALTENNNQEEEELTFGERFSDGIFSIGSKWKTIFVFAMFLLAWMVYNLLISPKYRFDPYPFSLMTFILAGIAAVQAPIIMISQHRQNDKQSKKIAINLKADNEVIALYQSITVLMEQQLQQVHKNQLLTIKILRELHERQDQKHSTPGSVPQSEIVESDDFYHVG